MGGMIKYEGVRFYEISLKRKRMLANRTRPVVLVLVDRSVDLIEAVNYPSYAKSTFHKLGYFRLFIK